MFIWKSWKPLFFFNGQTASISLSSRVLVFPIDLKNLVVTNLYLKHDYTHGDQQNAALSYVVSTVPIKRAFLLTSLLHFAVWLPLKFTCYYHDGHKVDCSIVQKTNQGHFHTKESLNRWTEVLLLLFSSFLSDWPTPATSFADLFC
jgi:hypothetical protein